MTKTKKPAAMSQVEYLEHKLKRIEDKISRNCSSEEVRELYFQKGKLYSELELMKRVKTYD